MGNTSKWMDSVQIHEMTGKAVTKVEGHVGMDIANCLQWFLVCGIVMKRV